MLIATKFIEIEVSFAILYVRITGVGELCIARGLGVTFNGPHAGPTGR